MTDTQLNSFRFDATFNGQEWIGERAACFALVAARDHLPWPLRMTVRPLTPGCVVVGEDVKGDKGTFWIPSVQRYAITPRYGLRCVGEIHAPGITLTEDVLKALLAAAERERADQIARMMSGESQPSGTVTPIVED